MYKVMHITQKISEDFRKVNSEQHIDEKSNIAFRVCDLSKIKNGIALIMHNIGSREFTGARHWAITQFFLPLFVILSSIWLQ